MRRARRRSLDIMKAPSVRRGGHLDRLPLDVDPAAITEKAKPGERHARVADPEAG